MRDRAADDHLYDYAGSYVCQAGAAQVPLDPVTDADLVLGAPIVFSAKRSRAELVNRIHGQFLDPSIGYQPQSYGAQVDAGATANDGEELGAPLDLMSTPSRTQAERTAKIRLREARAQGTASITLGFNHIGKQVGDWLPWNSAGAAGSRVWRIVDRRPDAATKAVTLDLEETNAAVYSWTAADEAPAPSAPVRIVPGGQISTVSGFGVAALSLVGGDNVTQIPALKFFWDPVTDGTVDGVVVEYRVKGSAGAATRKLDPTPGDGQIIVTDGVVGGVTFEARASIATTPARVVTWTPWVEQLTTGMVIGSAIEIIGGLTDDLNNILRLVTENIDPASVPALREKIDSVSERIAAIQTDAALQAFEQREFQRVSFTHFEASFGALSASFEQEVQLRAEGDEAGVALTTALRSELASEFGVAAVADISTRLATFVTPTTAEAIADTRIGVALSTGAVSSQAYVNTQVATRTTPSEATALADAAILSKIADGTVASEGYVETRILTRTTPAEAVALADERIAAKTADGSVASAAYVDSRVATRTTPADAAAISDQQLQAAITSGLVFAVADIGTRLAAYATELEAASIADARISAALSSGALASQAYVDTQVTTRVTPAGALAIVQGEISAQLTNGALASQAWVNTTLGAYATDAEAGAIAQTAISSALDPGGAIKAAVDTAIATRTTPTDVTALAHTGLTAALGAAAASGNIEFYVAATPAGALARYGIALRTAVGEAAHATGFYMDIVDQGFGPVARMFLDADNIYIGHGSELGIVPLAIVGGDVFINRLKITSSLQLYDGVVVTGRIAGNAVTTPSKVVFSTTTIGSGVQLNEDADWISVPGTQFSFTIDAGDTNAFFDANLTCVARLTGGPLNANNAGVVSGKLALFINGNFVEQVLDYNLAFAANTFQETKVIRDRVRDFAALGNNTIELRRKYKGSSGGSPSFQLMSGNWFVTVSRK